MTEREAVAYVESLAILGMRFGLDRMRRLLTALGEPQDAQPAVHVVGTNGKTSTTRIAAAALGSAGLRVGAYLSPHIVGWHERIEIDGAPIEPGAFAGSVGAVHAAAAGLDLAPDDGVTQFEVLTAAAFHAFAEAGVDAAAVEAGLGGRFDATNVLAHRERAERGAHARPVVVLTNVSREHTELLGETEAEIAAEKLAVCPDGFDRLVVGRLSPAAEVAVGRECARRGLSGWRLGGEIASRGRPEALTITTPGGRYEGIRLGIEGAFQVDNAAVAVAAAERLHGRPLDPAALRSALAAVRVPGRMERLPGRPEVLLDGAHNPAGVAALVESLAGETRRLVAVVSVLDDKDLDGMLGPIAARADAVVATRSSHPRAVDAAALARAAGPDAVVVPDPAEAVARASAIAGLDGVVLVCGSLYLLGDLRHRLQGAADAGASIPRIPGTAGPHRATRGN